jgi:uncharacterized ferritin-like protein (DUF455 family)
MKRHMQAEELARDERFVRLRFEDRINDPRTVPSDPKRRIRPQLDTDRPEAPDAARAMMHAIVTGEIQALEGAGRTCWDFEDDVPFAMKLDMARQCWDEARHCEISLKLGDWMGTEPGEYAENTILFEAACNRDPVLRLTGVNRALEAWPSTCSTPCATSARPSATPSSSSPRTGCWPTRSPT